MFLQQINNNQEREGLKKLNKSQVQVLFGWWFKNQKKIKTYETNREIQILIGYLIILRNYYWSILGVIILLLSFIIKMDTYIIDINIELFMDEIWFRFILK